MGYWIVVVDDEPFSLTNAKNLLRAKNMRVSCLKSGNDLLEFVEKNSPDLILLDILMPGMDGFETYRALREYEDSEGKPQIPVIFLTGEDNNETERRGLKAGASDYIHKPFDEDVLIERINNTIEKNKTIESLTEEATIDRLTGFLNKTSGTERISEICSSAYGALAVFDLDNFKLVNDLYGHDMGDRMLVAFSKILRHNVRSEDVISRIGGDEFMAFFESLSQEEAVASLTSRLNAQLVREAKILLGEEYGFPLGISVGVAFSSETGTDYKTLFQYADNALYEVKRSGKHGYMIFNPDVENNEKEENLDQELARIVEIMSEHGEEKGALLLGQDPFSWTYRYIERFLSRYGGFATRILFSLHAEEKDESAAEKISEFGNTIKTSLRRTDIIFQWQQNLFFVVMPRLAQEHTEGVVERLMQIWKETEYAEGITVKYVSSIVEKESFERSDS